MVDVIIKDVPIGAEEKVKEMAMVDSGASVGAIIPKGDYDYVIDFR
jgi:hypothetical protein